MAFFAKRKESTTVDFKPFFSVNDAIKLEYRGRYYSSRVEDIRDDSLLVAWPSTYGANLRIKDEDTFTLISSVRVGMNGFKGVIRERSEGPPAVLDVVILESLGRVQRRDYARVPETLTVNFRVIEPQSRAKAEFIETVSKNISGGGLLLQVEKKDRPMPGDTLEVRFNLPGGQLINARVSVIRVDPTGQAVDLHYEMALGFTHIHEQDRKLLIKRVFARETELRKAGLL